MKLIEEEFGGPKQLTFSHMVDRNTYNKITTLKNMKISKLDLINPDWIIMSMDLSQNSLTKFPVELAGIEMLKTLKLDENMISEVRYQELLAFKNLEQLDIRGNNMKKFCQGFDDLETSKKCELYHSHLKVKIFFKIILELLSFPFTIRSKPNSTYIRNIFIFRKIIYS